MKVATSQERLNELFDSDPRNDTAIADALGVSKQTISMWRHGTRSPKKSVLIDISKQFNVSIEWLMGFDVERNAEDQVKKVPVWIPNSQTFAEITSYMPQADYIMVMEAYERAYKRMKEEKAKNAALQKDS